MLDSGDHELPLYDPNGVDGKFSFLCLENGIKKPTRELDLVRRAQDGKKSVNLQIKLWSEDIGILLMPDEVKSYCEGMPEWVFNAVMEQTRKRYMKEIGFIPTFLKMGD